MTESESSAFNAFLQTTQKALQAQSELLVQLSTQVGALNQQLAATRYLAYALAHTHPNPEKLAESYLSLMDHTADTLPAHGAAALRDDMNVVLRELLALRPGPTA